MARIFTPEQQANIGQGFTNLMTKRWQQSQYERFLNNEFASFNSEMQGIMQDLGNIKDDDQDKYGEIMMRKRNATMTLFNAATQYSDNPKIAGMAQMVFQHDQNFLQNFMGGVEQMEGFAGRAETKERAVREQEAGIAHKEAQATNLEAQARLYDRTDPNARAGTKQDQVLFSGFSGQTTPNAYFASIRGTFEKMDAKKQNAILDRYRRDMAREALIDRIGQVKNPATGDVWEDNPEHLQAMMDTLGDDREVFNQWMRDVSLGEASAHGWTPQQVLTFPGASMYFDTDPALGVEPLRGPVPPQGAIKQLMGFDGANFFREAGVPLTAGVDDYTGRLPDNIQDLGNGPLQAVFKGIARNPVNPRTKERFQKEDEIANYILGLAEGQIEANVGGANIPDGALDADTRKVRKASRRLAQAMVKKYAPQIWAGMQQRTQETDTGLSLFNIEETGAYKAIESGLGLLKGAGGLFTEEIE